LGENSVTFRMSIHKGTVMCPKCGAQFSFGKSMIGEESITYPHCKYVLSYDDGFIEYIARLVEVSGSSIFFSLPICAGIMEMKTTKVKVGKIKEVLFKIPFRQVYDVLLTKSGSKELQIVNNRLILKEAMFVPDGITEKGFYVFSSALKESDILKEIEISYIASGRDSKVEKIPIWHKFLQNVIDLIRKKEYGMAVVQSMATFDAFFDDFLSRQLKSKRQYSSDRIKNILEKKSRRDKLFYYLHYVTGKTFEDSPYNEDLHVVADLRNRIVHPKEYEFNEGELKEENALKSLETVIKSMRWVNKTKE